MQAVTDEELAAVWRRWWLPGCRAEDVERVDAALASLIAHLEDYGFAIVRRVDPDL